jgi:type IV secretory pathway protease TraF
MEPELRAGDFLVATSSGPLRRDSVVVVEHPRRPGFELVKRVAGMPGDRVDGRVLQAHEYWVVGDRSDQSTDSRGFGPVNRGMVRGVVRLRYWPPSRIAWLG